MKFYAIVMAARDHTFLCAQNEDYDAIQALFYDYVEGKKRHERVFKDNYTLVLHEITADDGGNIDVEEGMVADLTQQGWWRKCV